MSQIAEQVQKLEVADLLSAYNGKAGKCACGCSGTHSYVAANRAEAEAHRGYAISDDEISDVRAANVLRKLQRNADAVEKLSDTIYSLVLGTRMYVVYLRKAAQA